MDIDNLNTVSSNNYRILGVDPGTYKMGVGIIEKDGTDITFNHSEVIEAGKLVLPNRLKLIYNRLTEVIKDFRPKEIAIEQPYVAKNVKAAIVMQLTGLSYQETIKKLSLNNGNVRDGIK